MHSEYFFRVKFIKFAQFARNLINSLMYVTP